jgi:hypothetical protein
MEAEIPIDQMVLVYRRIRDIKTQKQEQFEREVKALDEQLDTISGELLKICAEQGVDSLRTPVGTVTRTTTTRYWATDWEEMHKFILENDALDLLERRIHNGNMKQFMQENPDKVPVGLNADTKYTIRVRKPNNT